MDATLRSIRKWVNRALQHGGADSAFVWGVLDALPEDGRVEIEAISATGADAMNALGLAYGLAIGGSKVARDKLHGFWSEVTVWPYRRRERKAAKQTGQPVCSAMPT